VHCATRRLVQADLHVGQRGERCQDGLGTGRWSSRSTEFGAGPGVSASGAPCATTRAVAPIGMTLRWVNLGMANAPACRTPARPTSPVRLARCHVPAVN
jgi:hypothetical protein